MNCRKVRRYLFGYFRGELSSREAETIKAHLAACAHCAKEAEQIETVCLALRDSLESFVPSPDFNQRLLEKVQASPASAVVSEKRSWWAELLHEIFPSIRLRWAMAGAAGVLVVAFALMFTQKQSPVQPEYMSEAEQPAPAQVVTRPYDSSDSAYADLMRRLAEGSVVSDTAFVIERTSVPARQGWMDHHYVLPVVSNQRIPEKAGY